MPDAVMTSAPGTICVCSDARSFWRFRLLRNMKKMSSARTANMIKVNGSMRDGPFRCWR
ncbi:hypothetical protein BC477_12830 [Clavibacter michiganensis subsp. michiganensis]|uniref:Uncharacterized protein n=1 Tax=Clavibacter michiganensis subsp. michiganensis TaxID=33013 RepID=A0A251XI36_CLAMM|nr:hypothetical protein BC477_12830 [Clavibacter michiganensis subsp. michiganensis]OUE02679.1 hypothetical protein CMMCAS07_11735 [Clavibacter michiganensis subsp. michiganensis]